MRKLVNDCFGMNYGLGEASGFIGLWLDRGSEQSSKTKKRLLCMSRMIDETNERTKKKSMKLE